MFYSKDILTSKRRDGFAVIWLAATLGPKHSFKKLSKREVNRVNVVNAWYCFVPNLFVKAELTINVVSSDYLTSPKEPMALRLTSNLMVGVTRVYSEQYTFFYSEVNQVFHKLKRAWAVVQTADLDMPAPEAKIDTITFQQDDNAELPRDQPIVLRSNSLLEKQLDFGWVLQTPGASTNSPSVLSRSPSGFATMSLGAPSLDTASHVGSLKSITLDQSHVRGHVPFSGMSDNGNILRELDDPLLAPLDDNLPCIVGGDDAFDLFVDLREDNEAVKRRRMNRPGEDFNIGTFDFTGLGNVELENPQENLPMDIEGNTTLDEQLAPDVTQAVATHDEHIDEIPTKLRQKRKRVFIDATTELSHADMINMRNRVTSDLIAADKQCAIKAGIRRDKFILERILIGPSLDVGRDLADFWRKTVLTRQLDEQPGDTEQRKRTKTSGPQRASVFNDAFGAGFEDAFAGGFDGSLGDMSVEDPEMFRADNEPRKSEIMPWHTHSRAGSVGSDNTGSVRGASARKGGSARDSVSAHGDDFALDAMRRPRSYSGFGMSPLKGLPDFSGMDAGMDDSLIFRDDDLGLGSAERETMQFLNYVKEITYNADTNYVHFMDLLPQNATTRTAASRAFYHVLSLATRDTIIPSQTEAFADIRIELKQ
ncbi:Rec8 like protein-domain-containing protein [Powellomyces hirtus]|nr:Rec8 like protein-domain-containing protein [Powellomyces hirtus]